MLTQPAAKVVGKEMRGGCSYAWIHAVREGEAEGSLPVNNL